MIAMETDVLLNRHDRMLCSVFPTPTHVNTLPKSISISAGTSTQTINEQDEAWKVITSWLKLPRDGNVNTKSRRAPQGLAEAFAIILSDDVLLHRLVDWLLHQVDEYYGAITVPKVRKWWDEPVPCAQAADILALTLDVLVSSQNIILKNLDQWLESNSGSYLAHKVAGIRSIILERMHATVLHKVPSKRLFKTISFVLHRSICAWLIPGHITRISSDSAATSSLLMRLQQSGLGGESGQRAFAHAINAVVDSFIQSPAVKVDWVGRQSVTGHLRQWIQEQFIPLARNGIQCLTGDFNITLTESETLEWETIALEKLAKQRIKYLFEYVRSWDHSQGAILDLKEYISSTNDGKLFLANSFVQQMSRRILHAGVTTSELLSMYINVICAFKALDPRGVLLDKVAGPLRSYLRQRDDTVRIIAASFLTDVDADGGVLAQSDEVCSDLAREIHLSEGDNMKTDEKGLDWDDMSWVPDPIDAGPDYQKSKSDDIIAFMLTLFERNDFIKEVQALLGERLLTAEVAHSELEKEIRLVELFKARFGPEGLQSCEVMLRDILDSRRINMSLRPAGDRAFPTTREIHAAIPEDGITVHGLLKMFQSRIPRHSKASQHFISLVNEAAIDDRKTSLLFPRPQLQQPAQDQPAFSTLILSSFFWPDLREDEFQIPGPVVAQQKAFEEDFERIKNMRKLHWLTALGRAVVELELEDRTVKVENVQTWQASVIYAFQDNDSSADNEKGKTLEQLTELLSMDEVLVRNGLAFWIGHGVLTEGPSNVYSVLETLPTSAGEKGPTNTIAQAPQAADTAAISAVKSQDAVLRDNKEMYELFMIGMLTNGGTMDAARVTMMMKLVVPGGYAFGEEETKWVLAGLVEQEKVVQAGGGFAIKK